jgi:hypothetical protein
MDSRFFRKVTDPNFYENTPGNWNARGTAYKTVVSERNTFPTPDPRFPGYAGMMEDGRLITDYRPQCNKNVPVGSQYAVKEWMQKNTPSIIDVSRTRQAMITGAIYGLDKSVVPPPVGTVQCTATDCGYASGSPYGIGIERVDKAPEIFGTFDFNGRSVAPASHTELTTKFEAGRNTPRGREFQGLGNGPAFPNRDYHR